MHHFIFPLSRTPAGYRMPERVSLRALSQVLCYEWRNVLAYAVFSALLGVAYCVITPAKYEASVQIVPGDFTTKSTVTATAGLANLLLNSSTQSDAVKRFVTILYSPDLARTLAARYAPTSYLDTNQKSGWLAMIFRADGQSATTFNGRVRAYRSALSGISGTENKNTLATTFVYRSTDPKKAAAFLQLATKQGDELLRQYNLSEIRYDDMYLNNTISNAQNVDVRLALAQKMVETQLRRMDAERSEFFSIRTLGPIEVTDGPVWPRSKLITGAMFILGTLAGLIASLAQAYSRSSRDTDAGI